MAPARSTICSGRLAPISAEVTRASRSTQAVAVQRLLARAGVQAAFFAGDDLNDEPVFAAAQRHWVTLRIGCERRASAARFCIAGPHEMAGVLDRILAFVG